MRSLGTPIGVGGAFNTSLSRAAKLLGQVLDPAAEQRIRFHDLVHVLRRLGFAERRIGGSHHVLVRDGVAEIVNLQPRRDGTAKPYQVRQVRRLILSYGLHLALGETDDE
jgi:predicted RNA binding protein YcfA (HicA-like mRNA interferase family)